MVIGNPDANNGAAAVGGAGVAGGLAHPSGIPQDQIDNIMSGFTNTGDVKLNNHRKKLRQRFDIIKKLGQGTYGKVQLGINKETGQEVAIKTIKKCKIEAEADLVRIRREVQIMSSVQHPNIIHIYEVFENREKMVLVMEFAAGGELYDYLSERKVLSEEEARRIFRQVATAVYYCHKHKICHRDLKLENILLDERGNAKIADFGLSNVFDDQRLLATFCGSPLYASPEIVEGTPYQGPEVDCWSLGVLLYTLVYGSMPFDGSNFKRLVKQISQGDYYEPTNPSRASSLIRDMLTVCPRERASIEQICSHWWVNENDNVSCLDLAEDLANQTPVRLDVLLSLTPAAVTADQLVVPSADGGAAGGKPGDRVARSHSVGSIRDMGANTEAERRIMDMVAAGGEAALMPSPTRTITPAQSPVQTKRKLEPTVSMENAALKKKEKPANNASFVIKEAPSEQTPMETDDVPVPVPEVVTAAPPKTSFSKKDMQALGDLCEQLIEEDNAAANSAPAAAEVPRQRTFAKLDAVVETPEDAAKAVKPKLKPPSDPVASPPATPDKTASKPPAPASAPFVRKCSLQDDSTLNKFNNEQRRKSRILETAEKFQQMNAAAGLSTSPEKPKKFSIPGVSVGSFKKEFERKASTTPAQQGPTAGERRALEQVAAAAAVAQELEGSGSSGEGTPAHAASAAAGDAVESSDSKTSVTSVTLEDARRSMENSIALLRQAQNESSKEVDQLCAKTESIGVSDKVAGVPVEHERERKLKNARAIIGNAIQPVICRPQPFSGIGGGGGVGVVGSGGGGGGDGAIFAGGRGNGNYPYNGYLSSPSGESLPYLANGSPSFVPQRVCTPTPPVWGPSKTAPNVSALAAARQTIIDRLSGSGVQGGGFGSGSGNAGGSSGGGGSGPSSLPPSLNAFLATQRSKLPAASPATPFKQPAGQRPMPSSAHLRHSHPPPPQHQHQQQPHQQQQQQSHFPRHHSLTYSPGGAAVASPVATARAANAICNALANAQAKQAHHLNNNNNYATSTATTALPNVTTTTNNVAKPFYNAPHPTPPFFKSSPTGGPVVGDTSPPGAVKTSTASITLKSATLPRRKANAKTEIQLEIKPRHNPIPEQASPPPASQPQMRFTTEMQHPVADLRSAPPRDGPLPYSPIKTSVSARAASLEPKEHIIPIKRPAPTAYSRTTSNTTNRSLSRQSTGDSESESTTTNMSQSTVTGSSQPIKKSPREFIIPIAVEGGGFITPREGSIEPSESSHTASSRSTFSRLRPTRRIGSFLNDSGIDEGLPFAKMRTGSINREAGGEDDGRFTLHKLRSSRPVKKISQDNDSQSSGEEDDDDGFEILTAENLFSTLLQRVRALTNRMNVNNDLTAGFPNSSRLLSNLRQAQSPFWNQDRFGRSQVKYTFTETVEKKHVRLNNAASGGLGASAGVGAPWRHSMSRDLGSDMESMFSRTGATLPRGHKIPKAGRSSVESNGAEGRREDVADGKAVSDEPLDLADLDLSRLRLSKKDLETLSSIAPGLPKCFQEQLLAKLPPTQARKLSRTLSMQNSPQTTTVKIYKRSVSGGPGNDLKENSAEENSNASSPTAKNAAAAATTTTATTTERPTTSSLIYRRSLSRPRYDYEAATSRSTSDGSTLKSRSQSVCRDDYGKSFCSSYTSDINDRYKYYSPYLNKTPKETTEAAGRISPPKAYAKERDLAPAGLGRPPSGCLSPPPPQVPFVAADGGASSLRRRSSQRRISRFLRPDFFDEPVAEENPYQREKKLRERETQSVLREIRERSREPSRERDEYSQRKHSLPNASDGGDQERTFGQHTRNKSLDASQEYKTPPGTAGQDTLKRNRRSVSRTRDISEQMDKEELADRILQELQLLSAVRSQRLSVPREISIERTIPITIEPRDNAVESHPNDNEVTDSQSTIKKVKKPKQKEKPTESAGELEGAKTSNTTTTTTTTTVVKKVKKVIKKPDANKATNELMGSEELPLAAEPKKESKLKRPKSYPTKESTPVLTKSEIPCSLLPTKVTAVNPSPIMESTDELPAPVSTVSPANTAGTLGRESRLIRPKSYPASKLNPPKDSKKVTRSGIAIPSIAEGTSTPKARSTSRQSTYEENATAADGKGSPESSSSPESRPTTMKKVIKVTKKSKIAQPTGSITPSSSSSSPPLNGAESKESSPAGSKEKSPEKKPSKGLLYAIGQKFEKFRDSAMNKEKKAASAVNSSSATSLATKKVSPESNGLEKPKEKSSSLLKKKKSLEGTAEAATKKADKAEEPSCSKLPKTANAPGAAADKSVKSEKRSRIDAMIRSLRERSVPRSHAQSESNYIKRAVSVEEMPGTFNKNAVNKVLGLFKRADKEGSSERRVQSTRSTSNIERHIRGASESPVYANVGVEFTPTPRERLAAAKAAKLNGAAAKRNEANCNCSLVDSPTLPAADTTCPDCIQDQASSTKPAKAFDETTPTRELYQSSKEKRKGLMLDLNRTDNRYDSGTMSTTASRHSKASYANGNGLYSNLPPYPGAVNSSSANSSSQHSMDNNTTNNNNSFMTNNNSLSMHTSQTSGYRTSSAHEINRNHLLATPSTENMANYSSDSRSYQDECGSTSTFLSPTDEPELYFDNWSICSEDNYMLHATPSPTVSRLSRASQLSSPTRGGGDGSSDPNESVIDRIKRRSFYTRFNEKKPKRTSSIVGPSAVRDYYREQQAAVRARSSNKLNVPEEPATTRETSPNIVRQFLRPLKLSPAGTELKPPIYKSPGDYSARPRKSLHDIRPATSPSLISKRYGLSTSDNDYLTSMSSNLPSRYKSAGSSTISPYESNGGVATSTATPSSYYSTYNPKRRSSYTLNGSSSGVGSELTSSHIEGYATVGRRAIRPYDQRTMSLLDPSSVSSYRRENRTPVRDYTIPSISRSNSRYRRSSTSRSPTNI